MEMELRKVRLGEIASFVADKVRSDNITLQEYVTTDSLLQNKAGRTIAQNLPPQPCSLTRYKSGDVLVGNIRPYLKKIWLADGGGGCSNDVLAFRVKEGFSSSFLYAILSQDAFFDYLMLAAKGSKMPRGDKDHAMRFKVPSIPIEQQRRIGKLLSDLDRKIALNRRMNATLEAMARQLYDYWFLQFDFPDAHGKPYKSSGGKMTWNNKLKKEIPEGWEVKSIDEIEANIVTGKTPSCADSENFNGDIPFVTIDDIRGNLFVFNSQRTLSKKGADSQKNKYLPIGSLCVSCIGTVGVMGFIAKLSQTNQQINSIIFENECNKEFLYFSLIKYFENAKAKTGNVFANMSKEEFASIKVVYPPKQSLLPYHDKAASLLRYIKNNIREISVLTRLRTTLLPLLMNGQVEVTKAL